MNMNSNPKVIIAGAGSIGCYVGGLLQLAGHDTSFLGRGHIEGELDKFGLTLSDYSGNEEHIEGGKVDFHTAPEILGNADIILVCVKSGATADLTRQIKQHASSSAIVVSLQNGLRNGETLKSILNGFDVRSGMVPFNVVHLGQGKFHRGTSGSIVVENGEPNVASMLQTGKLGIEASSDMPEILWGKLLINLNNAVNALSGTPLLEQISNREWRKIMAAQIDEGLAVLKAEGIKPKPPIPAPAWALPKILRLPDFLFKRIAKQMISIDPTARSSMWEDLQSGRKTEIDELQGEIIRLGEKHGLPTPVNHRLFTKVKEAEAEGSGSPKLKPDQL